MNAQRLALAPLCTLLLLACERHVPSSPAEVVPAGDRRASQVGEHGGGPPGSIVFYSRRGGSLAKIYSMNADGSDIVPLTSGAGNDLWPDLSPNGRLLAFASNRTGNNEIYVLDLKTGALTNVSNSSADDSWPRWSPNGRELAFHSNRAGNYDIYVVGFDGSDLRQATTSPALDQWPDWSPDGKRLAFRRDLDIYVADADRVESNVERLTFRPTIIDQMPVWSPNGQQIAFMSFRDGYCAVFLMNADGSGEVNLTPKAPTDAAATWCSRAPAWSRNGQQIYFMSFRPSTNGDVELFVMDRDGGNLTRLTNSAGEDGGPQSR
jgi:TolB protein